MTPLDLDRPILLKRSVWPLLRWYCLPGCGLKDYFFVRANQNGPIQAHVPILGLRSVWIVNYKTQNSRRKTITKIHSIPLNRYVKCIDCMALDHFLGFVPWSLSKSICTCDIYSCIEQLIKLNIISLRRFILWFCDVTISLHLNASFEKSDFTLHTVHCSLHMATSSWSNKCVS